MDNLPGQNQLGAQFDVEFKMNTMVSVKQNKSIYNGFFSISFAI